MSYYVQQPVVCHEDLVQQSSVCTAPVTIYFSSSELECILFGRIVRIFLRQLQFRIHNACIQCHFDARSAIYPCHRMKIYSASLHVHLCLPSTALLPWHAPSPQSSFEDTWIGNTSQVITDRRHNPPHRPRNQT